MQMLKVYSVALLSLLAGATCVHQLFSPDLTLPVVDRSSDDDSSGVIPASDSR